MQDKASDQIKGIQYRIGGGGHCGKSRSLIGRIGLLSVCVPSLLWVTSQQTKRGSRCGSLTLSLERLSGAVAKAEHALSLSLTVRGKTPACNKFIIMILKFI